jgi:hypothetical protein
MQPVSAVAVFCEDIRQEQSGSDIIIGILPDTLNAVTEHTPGLPIFGKFGIYLRVHLDASLPPPKDISARLVLLPANVEVPLPGWDSKVIEAAFEGSRANDLPLVGLLLKAVSSPFPLREAGKIVAKVKVDGADYIAGQLNVAFVPPTASPPPS